MDFQTLLLILGIAVIAVIATVLYIRKSGAKPIQAAAVLYQDWAERFGIEPLDENPKAADANAKLLARNLKILWNKGELEELDLRPEIENLTQEDALAYTTQANELFLEKTSKAFAYDIHDAREGNLRLFTVEKDSPVYRTFLYGQAVIKMLRERVSLEAFPDIEFPEGSTDESLGALDSFVLAQAGLSTEPEELYKITSLLSEKFGDEWNVFLVAEDVLKFAKAEPEDEIEEEPKDLSPFAQQKELKRKAAEEEAAAKEAAALERRLIWEAAEKRKKEEELSRLQAAISSGEVSELITKPLAFLSQAIEIAADESDILTLDDEADIKRVDRVGIPVLFTVYSSELIDTNGDPYSDFTRILIESLETNFGGVWAVEPDSEFASSISFTKGIA